MTRNATSAVIIQQQGIESIWPLVKDFIAKCDGEISTADDLYSLLLSGSRTLILVIECKQIKGACIAKEVNGFRRKIVITTLGGEGGDWNAAIDDFSRQLIAIGHDRLEIQGRRGWLKALNGFEELHTTIGRNI